MTRNELQNLCDEARKWLEVSYKKGYTKINGNVKSDACLMVLELMDTEEHANNYCSALREVLNAFPEVDRDELETELDRFI